MTKIDIAQDTLLGIDEICSKLAISRSTLERLRGGPVKDMGIGAMLKTMQEGEGSCKAPFPQPSCMIGRSPRWTVAAINHWLSQLQ